jgi:hypothetical protein
MKIFELRPGAKAGPRPRARSYQLILSAPSTKSTEYLMEYNTSEPGEIALAKAICLPRIAIFMEELA